MLGGVRRQSDRRPDDDDGPAAETRPNRFNLALDIILPPRGPMRCECEFCSIRAEFELAPDSIEIRLGTTSARRLAPSRPVRPGRIRAPKLIDRRADGRRTISHRLERARQAVSNGFVFGFRFGFGFGERADPNGRFACPLRRANVRSDAHRTRRAMRLTMSDPTRRATRSPHGRTETAPPEDLHANWIHVRQSPPQSRSIGCSARRAPSCDL